VALVGTDLWLNDRAFWNYSNAPDELFAGDAIKTRLHSLPRPFRVWDVDVYPGAALMADDISQLYGHHGNEPHAFDVVNAREGESLSFARAGDPQILDLFAVNYLIVPASSAPESLPGFRRTVTNVATSSGTTATLFEREQPVPYARLIPAAAVPASASQIAGTVIDPQFAIDRVVLLESLPGIVPGTIPNPLPPPSDVAVSVTEWRPGGMRVRLGSGCARRGLSPRQRELGRRVAREHRWEGRTGTARRRHADHGARACGRRDVVLRYEGRSYARGRAITIASLLVVAIVLVMPPVIRRRRTA
jgi:hypothetical protein